MNKYEVRYTRRYKVFRGNVELEDFEQDAIDERRELK
jgi:hypothetical protein